MRTIHRATRKVSAGLATLAIMAATAPPIHAQQELTINQSQTGLNLPGVISPHGYDEVRAADGTSCRASMSGTGAYLDSGVIGGGIGGTGSTVAAYGRLVVPLGQKPRRLDCDRLYQLELERLELEVQLLKQGVNPRTFIHGGQDLNDNTVWTRK